MACSTLLPKAFKNLTVDGLLPFSEMSLAQRNKFHFKYQPHMVILASKSTKITHIKNAKSYVGMCNDATCIKPTNSEFWENR